MNSKVLRIIIYFTMSISGGVLLILLSELLRFSHLNLIPLGGPSWAIWFHPLAFIISFNLINIIFKIFRPLKLLLLSFIIFFLLFYIIYSGYLFINPLPFNVS